MSACQAVFVSVVIQRGTLTRSCPGQGHQRHRTGLLSKAGHRGFLIHFCLPART